VSDQDRRIWEAMERLAKSVTDDKGRFHKKLLTEELEAFLRDPDVPANMRQRIVEISAAQFVSRFVQRRTPRPGRQGGLFNDDRVLALGTGECVWMGQATEDDLAARDLQVIKNLRNVSSASTTWLEYSEERRVSLRAHPSMRLGEVEREYFGFIPEAEDLGEGGDEEPF
jgi:uncharacterized protein (UPF0147 family)